MPTLVPHRVCLRSAKRELSGPTGRDETHHSGTAARGALRRRPTKADPEIPLGRCCHTDPANITRPQEQPRRARDVFYGSNLFRKDNPQRVISNAAETP